MTSYCGKRHAVLPRMTIGAMVLLLLLSFSADGATGDESLRVGSWSIQFGAGRNLTLQPLGGFSLSVKRHFSDRSAIGMVATLTGGQGGIAPTSGNRSIRHIDVDDFGIQLSPVYIYYPNRDGAVKLVVGLGPDFGFSLFEQTYERRASSSVESPWMKMSYSRKVYSVGINGLLGGEWFFTRRMSLFANYGSSLRFQYTERKEDRGGTRLVQNTYRRFELCDIRTELGLSLYF